MNKKLDSFLDSVCIHVKCKTVHKDIRDELTSHIDELKGSYAEQGMDQEKALDMAISAMGDSDEIGSRLNKQHKPQTEWSLIGLTVIIAVIGGIIMFLSSKADPLHVNFKRYLIYAAVGTGVLTGFYFFDYTKLKKVSLQIYLVAFFMLCYTLIFGASYNGAKFFIIGRFSASVEYVLILFLVAITGFIEKNRGKGIRAIVSILILAFIPIVLVMRLPHLSVAFILMICCAVLILASISRNHYGGNKKSQFIFSLGLGAVIITFGIFHMRLSAYQWHRLISFLPRTENQSYQQKMADEWLSMSSLFTKAVNSTDGFNIFNTLPGANTEYVLVNIVATLGWGVGIATVLLISVFIFKMFMTTKKIKNDYGFYLSLGACTILSAHFIIGILVNFNLFPLLRIGIPFLSYGGMGYVASMSLVGIILSVWRRNNLISTYPCKGINQERKFIQIEDGKLIIHFK